MAERLGYKEVNEYGRIELGKKRLTLELLEAIASIFQMSVIALLSFDEKMVFNHCAQDHSMFGNGNNYHDANLQLVAEMKERIVQMQGEVDYLRKQLAVAMGSIKK